MMNGRLPRKVFTAEQKYRAASDPVPDFAPPPPDDHTVANGIAAERHRELLSAIGAVETRIDALSELKRESGTHAEEIEAHAVREIGGELRSLSTAIEETKREIAWLRPNHTEDDRIERVTHELDAVVSATESATEQILGNAEHIEGMIAQLRNQTSDETERGMLDDVSDRIVAIFESCNFQDITGQRINKVVNTLKFIEQRVDRMIDILGGQAAFSTVVPAEEPEEDEDAKLLHGPQLEHEKEISQDDIDKLFD